MYSCARVTYEERATMIAVKIRLPMTIKMIVAAFSVPGRDGLPPGPYGFGGQPD